MSPACTSDGGTGRSRSAVAVVGWGDPTARKTWSGAVVSLTQALLARGVAVTAVEGRPPRPVLAVAGTIHRLQGYGVEWRRGPLVATASRLMVRRALRHDRVGAVLYVGGVGILGVPTKHPGPIPQFAICDSIWQSRPHDRPMPQGVTPAINRAIARREVEGLHSVNHVFCTSRSTADDVIETGVDPEHVTVIGTGTGPIRPYEGPKDYTSRRILFVAQQRAEEKGLSLLLRAFELVRSASPSATLTVVCGSTKLDPEQLPQGVEVLPRVDLATLQSLFDQATLFAMPALLEPWGLVYLESLLCRTPVLGLRRMGYPEIAGGGRYGFIVDRPDPRLVADGILSALSDPARLATMGQEGQANVIARFTWAAAAERIHSVLKRYM